MFREITDRSRDGRSGPANPTADEGTTGAPLGIRPDRVVARHFDSAFQAPDEPRRARQEAGLAALVEIAMQVSFVMSEAPTAVISAVPAWPVSADIAPDEDDHVNGRAGPRNERGRVLQVLHTRLRGDHLVRNSLYLILSSGIQAALGFTFWIIMARLYSTADVGRASSLAAATALLAFFALFGLNSTLVRYLPTAPDRSSLITGALFMSSGCAAALGLLYILMAPVFAPRLSFVGQKPALAAGFVVLTAAAAVNLLTDSVFIASRKSGLCALTDGAVGGVSKIVFGVVLAGSGAYGLFCASAGGLAAAGLVSIVMMIIVLRWRPSFSQPFRALKPLLKFSGANYAANALNLLPSVVVPIIVLDRLGAEPAAYYFVAFQIATLLYAAVYAVEQAFLAEGSQAEADWRQIRNRSRRFAAILFLPGCAVLGVTAHWVLLAFGGRYSQNGTASLQLLAVGVIPIAVCNWSWTVLRLSGSLRGLVSSCAFYAVAICGTAWILAPHGLTALTSAWPIGSTFGGCVAMAAVLMSPKAPARHRRPANSPASPSLIPASSTRGRRQTDGSSKTLPGRHRLPQSRQTTTPGTVPLSAQGDQRSATRVTSTFN